MRPSILLVFRDSRLDGSRVGRPSQESQVDRSGNNFSSVAILFTPEKGARRSNPYNGDIREKSDIVALTSGRDTLCE